jgi:hypothetical protein
MNFNKFSYDLIPLSINFQIFKFEISDNIKESIFNKIFTKNNFKSGKLNHLFRKSFHLLQGGFTILKRRAFMS